MERIQLPASDVSLSRIIYGMWRLGDDDSSPAHVQAKIELCLEQGITTFDQADIYGNYESEQILGATLKASPQLRENMEIISKCGIKLLTDKYPSRRVKHYDTSAEHIRASVDSSLSRMGIEQLDVLLIHRPDPFMDHFETGACLDALVASGKVKSIGVSNFARNDWELLQSAMTSKLVTNQLELSLLNSEPFTNGSITYLQKEGIVPMAWSPLGGGRLFSPDNATEHELLKVLSDMSEKFGCLPEHLAVAWLLAHPVCVLPVLGTNNLDRIRSLSTACSIKLDREDWFLLLQAANGHEVP